MKTIGNLLWFIFTGLLSAAAWLFLGLIWCVTIIGIPFGKQCFKLASLSLWPFGRSANGNFGAHPFGNAIWFIFGGFALACTYIGVGLLWCITIVGIPFGKQCFKLAGLAIAPFGAKVN